MRPRLPFERILLTGARGFVGRRMFAALRAHASDDALVVAAVSDQPREQYGEVAFDLLNAASIERAVVDLRPDLIIHLAAQAWSVGSTLSPADSWAVNCAGTLSLATAVARHVPKSAFLYVSSAEVYGLAFNDGPAGEATLPRPTSVYAHSKAAAETLLLDILGSDARLAIARPSNHTGKGQDERFVVPAFAAQIARIEAGTIPPVIRVGDLTPRRDFLDVLDVIKAYLSIIRLLSSLTAPRVLNVGSGQAVAIGDILDGLLALSHVKARVEVDQERLRPNQVRVAINDASALRNLTGWRPEILIGETLRGVLDEQRARLAVPVID